MRREILLLLVITTLGFSATTKEVEAFKAGFNKGVNAIKSEASDQAYESKKLNLKAFILTKDIDALSTADVMYYKHIGIKEGLSPIIMEHKIIFSDFDREPDANAIKQNFSSNYGIDLAVESVNKSVDYYSYPLIYKDIYKMLEYDIKSKNKVIVITKYSNSSAPVSLANSSQGTKQEKTPMQQRIADIMDGKINTKAEQKKDSVPPYFVINANRAQLYKYDFKKDPSASDSNKWKDELFSEYRMSNKNEKGKHFVLGKILKSDDGIEYVKANNENLFIIKDDVKIVGN